MKSPLDVHIKGNLNGNSNGDTAESTGKIQPGGGVGRFSSKAVSISEVIKHALVQMMVLMMATLAPVLVSYLIVLNLPQHPFTTFLTLTGLGVLIAAAWGGTYAGIGALVLSLAMIHLASINIQWLELSIEPFDWIALGAGGLAVVFLGPSLLPGINRVVERHGISADIPDEFHPHIEKWSAGIVWSCRADGRWDFVSKEWRALTGLTLADLNRLGCEAVMHHDDAPAFSRAWATYLETPKPFELTLRIRGLDGRFHPLRTTFFPDINEVGKVVRWILISSHPSLSADLVAVDNKALRLSDFNLKDLPAPLARVDAGHIVKEATDVFLSTFRIPRPCQLPVPLADIIGMENYAQLLTAFEQVAQEGYPMTRRISWRREGIEVRVEFYIEPALDHLHRSGEFWLMTTELPVEDQKIARRAAILDEVPEYIWVYSLDLRIVDVNARLLEFAGLTRGEVLAGGEKLFLNREDFANFKRVVDEALDLRSAVEFEVRLINSEGRSKPVQSRISPMRDDMGRITGWVVAAHDRVEKADRAVLQPESLFRDVGEAVPDFFWSVRPDFTIEFGNRRLQEFCGLTQEQIKGGTLSDLLHTEDWATIKYSLALASNNGESFEAECRYRTAKGDYAWFKVRVAPVSVAGEKIERWIGTATSLEPIKNIQNALQANERRYRLALSAGKIGVWEWNFSERMIFVSGRLGEQLGLEGTATYLKPRLLLRLIHRSDRRRALEVIRDARRKNRDFDLEIRVVGKDRKVRWLMAYGTVAAISASRAKYSQEFNGVFGAVVEITERKEAELRLEQALVSEQLARRDAERSGQERGRMLAAMSSELKAPMNAFVGWTQALRTSAYDREALEQRLKAVEKNAGLQAQLVDDLLEVSRIISGSLTLTRERFDLRTILNEVLETVRPAARRKSLKIELNADMGAGVDLGSGLKGRLRRDGEMGAGRQDDDVEESEPTIEGPVYIWGDPYRLQQLLWSVVFTAVEFSLPGADIEVILSNVGGGISVIVAQPSGGRTALRLVEIFERAAEWSSFELREERSAAVAMLLAKYIAELHKGSLAMSNRAGQLSWQLVLPNSRGLDLDNSSSPELRQASPLRPLDGCKVLVVNSDALERQLVVSALERSGATVLAIGSTDEALELLRENRFDLVIGVPRSVTKSGSSLTRLVELTVEGAGEEIPSVALIPRDSKDARAEARRLGFNACIPTPVDPLRLVSLVRDLTRSN